MIKASLLFSLAILGPACARHACNPGSYQSHRHSDGASVYNLKTSETSVQMFSTSVSSSAAPTSTAPVLAPASFSHPGLLHADKDFARIRSKLAAGEEPWTTAWNKLLESSYASSSYVPNPVAIVYRGYDGIHAENYDQLYRDVAAAYVLAIRWAITQEREFGDAALRIMDAWSSTLTALSGTVDVYLAAGIYGYEFAQAGEIMRDYEGWSTDEFQQFKGMMTGIFYKQVDGWFTEHENWASYAPGVYANWDLSQIASAMSIGVLADDTAIYNRGIRWFYNGTGNGQINEAVPFMHFYDNQLLGQTMESGRDQGHNTLNIALLGVIGQTAYNQGNDLFAYNSSIILAASEYVARYNLGYDVPYTPYDNGWINMPTISSTGRGQLRPNWELLYNHYGVLKNENVTWTKQFRDLVVSDNGGAEGGSGDYGPNSGGYDQLGWGTLLYTLK
ncbi:chondroitin AC/alginate lyase [Ilyonectria sp. MPI-CAGE-AT-0026]|nr:chondroitin AC/alginate lyase [Ilyonectria sp. MPI-CAGE-AT-0026]